MLNKSTIDYTLYLVTNNELVPAGTDIYTQIEHALYNGATVVQLREKHLDTGIFIDRAKKIHELTKKFNVPLIINDRVDVALAIDAEGVHIGHDDMDPATARNLLGKEKILGYSVRNEAELYEALESEACIDYVGIGAVHQTDTKSLKKSSMGTEGVQKLLKIISQKDPSLKSVVIGGLNKYNITSTLKECSTGNFQTNGVAVVSCIMGQKNAAYETKETLRSINLGFGRLEKTPFEISKETPLVHFITNSVVQNISANICIAVGGSPAMSQFIPDFTEFASSDKVALVLNVGTPETSLIPMYKAAIKEYNSNMKPIVFDPVGCGATNARFNLTKELLNVGQFSVIKGNLSELLSIFKNHTGLMRGVDSIGTLKEEDIVQLIQQLANETRSVVVMTGMYDYIADGITCHEMPKVCKIEGGHHFASLITGSGCSLGGVIARFIAIAPHLSTFDATINAVSIYKEAAYLAGTSSSGPSSFTVNFVDSLYHLASANELPNTRTSFI